MRHHFVSNKMFWSFVAIVFTLQATDIYLASQMLTPEIEFNPIARWVWASAGFWGLVAFKITALCIGFTAMAVVNHKNPRLAKYTMTILMVICALPLVLYALV